MARRRYFRYYPRRTVAKKKWASNILHTSVSTSGVAEICKNSVQSTSVSPTPVILKCGNFKVQGDVMYASAQATEFRPINLNIFLMFCPEGVSPSNSLIGNHPEWVIGWKALDVGLTSTSSGTTAASSSFSFSSRLKRNLNSGDRVIALLQTTDTAVTAQAVFTCQYWTCAN